ncbi:unnamed protein product, partial [Musa acuminata subsp. burmannicoides]
RSALRLTRRRRRSAPSPLHAAGCAAFLSISLRSPAHRHPFLRLTLLAAPPSSLPNAGPCFRLTQQIRTPSCLPSFCDR